MQPIGELEFRLTSPAAVRAHCIIGNIWLTLRILNEFSLSRKVMRA